MAYSERLLKAIASGKGVIKERTPEEQIAEQIDILWSLLKVVERRTCYIYCETDKQVEAIISAVGEIGIRVDVGDEKFVATLPDKHSGEACFSKTKSRSQSFFLAPAITK